MPAEHKKYGGSTAGRTIECNGWHVQAEGLPRPPESDAAREGTALHACMEMLLLGEVECVDDLRGRTIEGITIDADHVLNKLTPALMAWEQLCERFNIESFEPEVPVKLSDDIGGTLDVIGEGSDVVAVVDWKFGDGVMVYPIGNPQGLHYTLCASRTPAVEDMFVGKDKVVIAIIQPTDRDGEETLRVWETNFRETVRAFEIEYLESVGRAEKAHKDDHDLLAAGPWCRFCPAEAVCPLKTGLVERSRRLDVETLDGLGHALDVADEMEKWIAAVRKMAHEQMDRGDKVPGYKLVHKRAYQRWTNEDDVEAVVKRRRKLKREETHEAKLLSPAKMKDLYKAKGLDTAELEEHISRVSSGTTIAKASDPRPEAPAVSALRALAARGQ